MGAPRRAGHTKGHGTVAGGSAQAQAFIAEQQREEEYERQLRGEPDPAEEAAVDDGKARNDAWLELQQGDTNLGRLTFRLFDEYAPQASHNFRTLCKGTEEGLQFIDSPIHKVVKDLACYGGDVTEGDGTGGKSVYLEESFRDESNPLKWDEAGLLGTVALQPDENRSQFLISFDKAPQLEGKHVIFGRLLSGKETLEKIRGVAVDHAEGVDPTCRPTETIRVVDCGVVKPLMEQKGVDLEDLDELESLEFLHHKAKRAKLEQKEARDSVQSALAAGLKKKKKKDKKRAASGGAAALPIFGL